MFAIVMDSTSSTPTAKLNEMGITVVPLTVNFGDESYIDGETMMPDEFYKKMAEHWDQGLPMSACPAPGKFEEAYRNAAAAEDIEGIVCMTLGSGISQGYNSACVAAQAVAEDGIRVEVIDSLATTQILSVMARKAAEMRDAGATLDEVAAHMTRIAKESRSYYALDRVENLIKGGRLTKSAGFAANLLHIKPILELEKEKGAAVGVGKARGSKALLKDSIKLVEDAAANMEGSCKVFFSHANALDRVATFTEMLEAKGIECDHDNIGWIGSVIGTHVGENAVGLIVVPKALL